MTKTIPITTIVIDVAFYKTISELFFAYRVAVTLSNLIPELLIQTADMNLTNRSLFANKVVSLYKS